MTIKNVFSRGIAVALLILLGFELYLHNDDFLYRYRSVFAVGRAADKLFYVERVQPKIIFFGNSRVDNGVDPRLVAKEMGLPDEEVFNFGVPGSNTRILAGLAKEMAERRVFQRRDPQYIVLGLDESWFTLADDLNYSIFFADRLALLKNGEWRILAGSILRLWGFAINLKGLREPSRMLSFLRATLEDRDPWGGPLTENRGFRAKQGELNEDDLRVAGLRKEVAKIGSPLTIDYFFDLIDTLTGEDVQVLIYVPPYYGERPGFFERRDEPAHRRIIDYLEAKGIPVLQVEVEPPLTQHEFADLGHLNPKGSERFSKAMGRVLAQWLSGREKP